MDIKRYLKFFNTTPAYVAVSPGQIIPVANDAQYNAHVSNHLAGIRRLAIFPLKSDGTTPLAVIRFRSTENSKSASPLCAANRVRTFLQNGLSFVRWNDQDSVVTPVFDEWQIPSYLELTGVPGQEAVNLWLFLHAPRPAAEVWLALQSLLMGMGCADEATVCPAPIISPTGPRLDEAIALPYYPGLPDLFNGSPYGSLQTGRTHFLDLNQTPDDSQQGSALPTGDLPATSRKVSAAAFDKLAYAVSPHNNQARAMLLHTEESMYGNRDTSEGDGDFSQRLVPIVVKVELTQGVSLGSVSREIHDIESALFDVESSESEPWMPIELQAKLAAWLQMPLTTRMEAVKSHLYTDFHQMSRGIQELWVEVLVQQASINFAQIGMWAREGFATLDLNNTDLVDVLLRAQKLDYTPEQCGRTFVDWLKSNGGVFHSTGDGPELTWKGAKYMVGSNQEFKALYWELTGRGDSRVPFDSALEAIRLETIRVAVKADAEPPTKRKQRIKG